MRNLNYLVFGILVIALVACNKIKPKNVVSSIEQGIWRISLYTDDGQNETNDYSGYEFNFENDGTVTATNGDNNIIGSWSVEDDESNDDSSSDDDIDFILNFPSEFNFEELSDDWSIISESSNVVELEDVSGGDGSVDQLTFEKL